MLKEAFVNLDSCTEGQRRIITTLDKPLMVSAGAGSGKTFTLTQRIAYALTEGGPDGKPFASSIDEVLAITFTKKAAAELKSRIKRQLLSMGLTGQALKVDDAWISTIHGMCSRMLREHALELGLDPAFEVISQTQAAALRDEAFDQVVFALDNEDDLRVRSYIHQIGIHSAGFNSPSLEKYVQAVSDRVLALPDGFDALVMPEVTGDPSALLRQMMELGEAFVDASAHLSKPGKTDAKHLDECERALERAQAYVSDVTVPHSFEDERFDWQRYASVLYAFPKTSPKYRTKDSDPEFFQLYREDYAEVSGQVEAAFDALEQRLVVAIAQQVHEAYQALKGPARLDNTDLLRQTHAALVEHPDLAAGYRRQFALIMVDEFQDTDQLQVAILSQIAKPGLANLCTVGDAQQSIYRFRGADVSVFYAFEEQLKQQSEAAAAGTPTTPFGDGAGLEEAGDAAQGAGALPEAQFVSLPDNFRSHAEVLSFVDAIFSQPSVFGSRFLSLAPQGKVNETPDPLFDEHPRITMALFDCKTGGAGVDAGRKALAKRIAEHFASLRDASVPDDAKAQPRDMALLLGAMSNVGIYAQALRDQGFECLVSGGSTFSGSYEVGLIKSMVTYFADQLDDEACYELLASPLFTVSDDAFVHLSTRYDRTGAPHRRSLAVGALSWQRERGMTGLPEAEQDNLDFALGCVSLAKQVVAAGGLAAGVEALIKASGWFVRLQGQGAQGQAVAGNVHKALGMLRDTEALGFGIKRTAQRFIDDCETLKLAPGTLSTTSANFVQIMTVHASKGLEFGHVAVAELGGDSRSPSLVAENIGGRTYCMVKPRTLDGQKAQIKGLHQFFEEPNGTAAEVVGAPTQAQRSRALEAYVSRQELAESRRLLYVALTRASKSLFLGFAYRGNKTTTYEGKGILEDLHGALNWDTDGSAPEQRIDYGGKMPLHLEFRVLDKPAEEKAASAQAPATTFAIPAHPLDKPLVTVPISTKHDEVFSYSSLPYEPVSFTTPEQGVAPGDSDAGIADGEPFVDLGVNPDEDATALGLAFHRLAQAAIDGWQPGEPLEHPKEADVDRQARLQGTSPSQKVRLTQALDRWFGSDVAHGFAQHAHLAAEVPFMISLGSREAPVFLEGEIDGLAFDQAPACKQGAPSADGQQASPAHPGETAFDPAAWIVDYKTGGSPLESADELTAKHLLQAQCYALGLLRQGFGEVEATFVRVEREDPQDPTQPQTVTYRFSQADQHDLESLILRAYQRRDTTR